MVSGGYVDSRVQGFFFITGNVCGRRRLAFFFFARARPRNFSLRSWQEKKSRRLHLGTLDEVFPGILDYHMKLLSSTFTCTIYFEGFIRKYPFDFFVHSWFYQQLGVKKSTLDLWTAEFRRKTTHLLLDEGDAWPSMGIYSDSRSSWKYNENDGNRNQTQAS